MLTPYAGLTLGGTGSRSYRAGARWQLGPDVAVGLEATRQEASAGDVSTEMRLRAVVRF